MGVRHRKHVRCPICGNFARTVFKDPKTKDWVYLHPLAPEKGSIYNDGSKRCMVKA